MATVVTDYVALYLLPDKEIYNDCKYEVTDDKDEWHRKSLQKSLSAAAADNDFDRLIDSEEHVALYGDKRRKGGKGEGMGGKV